MDFSLRFVVSLLLGAMILLAVVIVIQDNAASLQSFMGEFMTLEDGG
jgi:lipid-A-disaccharide synthase-like uncharacterized protein